MKLIQKILYPTLAFGLSLLFLSVFFGDIMRHPNSFVTEGDGDGIKNHFVYSYYLKYDKGLHFTGMNYPYGEHVFFPDAQPLLSMSLNWVNTHLFRIEQYGIGISNLLLFWSVGFCGLFMFFILRKFKLPPWYAVLIAVLIACLSPQFNRVDTHQSLAYAAFIPMLWYFMLALEDAQRRKWLWAIVISLHIFVFAGLHLYYLAMGFFFVLAYIGIAFISNLKALKNIWRNLALLFVAGLMPLVFYQLFLHITDADIATRIQNPWGFFHYTARFESIFIPVYTPFEAMIKYYIKLPDIKWEGYGAVGIVGSFVFVFTILRVIRFFKQKKFVRFFRFTSSPRLNQFMWAGVLLLLFSMAVPFTWGLESLLDYLPQLKQFRSVGRFNWVFFYIFTTYAACYIYWLYKRMLQKAMRPFAQFFMVGMLLLWVMNDYAFLKHARTYNEFSYKENYFKDQPLPYLDSLAEARFNVADYQAIIALPFYHRGSEKFGAFNSRITYRESMAYAYHIGLPMMNAYMARMPIDKALKIAQMWGDTIIEKDILRDFPSDKPFLGVVFENEDYPLTAQEAYVVNKGKLIAKSGHVRFYEIPLSAFQQRTAGVWEQFNKKDSLHTFTANGQTYFATQPKLSYFFHESFDNLPSKIALRGGGALEKGKEQRIELFNATLPENDTMRVSYWLKKDYLSNFPNLHHQVLDEAGNMVHHGGLDAAKQVNYQNGWMLMEMILLPQPKGFKQVLFLADVKQVVIDDFVIQPSSTHIFWQNEEKQAFIYDNITVSQF